MTQKELKLLFIAELSKAWTNPKMIDYCSKQAAILFTDDNGGIYEIKKPTIETSFCFGAGLNGLATDEELNSAYKAEDYASTHESYFIHENLREINRWISDLQEIRAEVAAGHSGRYAIVTGPHYSSQTEDCKLMSFGIVDKFCYSISEKSTICEDVTFIDRIISAYEQVKTDFIKRLNTYLKRYGLTKIKTWTYISD